ncbi:1-acyl-sn-glycerol-3-phosphate acyltransferase [Loktanella sp. F6476L]|uniref:1-acyl-sn-glycerol-3-phosphate acyltransferase n=1 Tax=Loktanella sp. F6476L TaxID=2926405 RepID=UPI001FF52B21|nr:1-acyl-sn-glycerol-3-phosphate acyltransferase [Loktanella sp. F6476L]MCK0120216.1 1-acyl-sn-glycerol-3-phosphate acyltransferase [Loktanella sp. F6476L]
MTQPVTLPLWAFILIVLFAAVTFASHFLFPSVRWFFRRRAEKLIAQLNTRLERPIEPFKLARRYDMIQRLLYDPEITQAIVDHARENNVPENVAFEKAQHYAREIVPSFSATVYFTFGMRIAKWLSRMLYRVRLGSFDRDALQSLDKDATVIFVMNHRSNMDYVLVTYLVSRASALSYAVGEWARVWPLSGVIRMMGAYFIRRRSRTALYRRVLARYVQLATDGGVTQAMFPEGGLSLTGEVGNPKLGLLNYIVESFEDGDRDVIFVPVALNYDQVLEDRFLIKAGKGGNRRFRPPLWTVISSVSTYFWRRLTGQFKGFGTASVAFGAPLTLSKFDVQSDLTSEVAQELMSRIRAVVPVLAAPLVARAIVVEGATSISDLEASVGRMLDGLKEKRMPLPKRNVAAIVDETLGRFVLRNLLERDADEVRVKGDGADLLGYYANSIKHHFPS